MNILVYIIHFIWLYWSEQILCFVEIVTSKILLLGWSILYAGTTLNDIFYWSTVNICNTMYVFLPLVKSRILFSQLHKMSSKKHVSKQTTFICISLILPFKKTVIFGTSFIGLFFFSLHSGLYKKRQSWRKLRLHCTHMYRFI
jgi:hypothetical protein